MSAAGEKKKTACVTGGNGYIASALIKMLLEKGYAVKTTVRNPGSIPPMIPLLLNNQLLCICINCSFDPDDMAKNSHLKDLQALGHLEVLRADMDEEGSFDEAVAGCDYAFLVAAPVNLASEGSEVRTLVQASLDSRPCSV
jgi:anthocyanidin reductase